MEVAAREMAAFSVAVDSREDYCRNGGLWVSDCHSSPNVHSGQGGFTVFIEGDSHSLSVHFTTCPILCKESPTCCYENLLSKFRYFS